MLSAQLAIKPLDDHGDNGDEDKADFDGDYDNGGDAV